MILEFAIRLPNSSTTDENLRICLGEEIAIKHFDLDIPNEYLVVDTTLSVSVLLKRLRSLGYEVIFRGTSSHAELMQGQDFGSGVATLADSNGSVVGVCRLFQPTNDLLIVDAVVSKLSPSQPVTVAVHTFGDLSDNDMSCGDFYSTNQQHTGLLGTIVPDENGAGILLSESTDLKLWDLIGRSIILHHSESKSRLAYGVIARSAILRTNKKTVCDCSGRTMWEQFSANPVDSLQ